MIFHNFLASMRSKELTEYASKLALINKSITVLFVLATSFNIAHAHKLENTIREFSMCNDEFFKGLRRNADAWEADAPLKVNASTSKFEVPDRNNSKNNSVTFKKPIAVADLLLLSYFDEISDMGQAGMIYNWGFTVNGELEEVALKLRPLIYDSSRLHRDGDVYARTEVRFSSDSIWLTANTPSGVATGTSKTERVLLIEVSADQPHTIRIGCSLQGRVDAKTLHEVRPDIDLNDYSSKLSSTFFEDISVPEDVMNEINLARNGKDFWRPKFKSLTYTVALTSTNKPGESTYSNTLKVLLDKLIMNRETYSENFYVDRVVFAGMVQTKARMSNYSDGSTYLTKKLKISIPDELTHGSVMSYEIEAVPQPESPYAEKLNFTVNCEAKESINAEIINSRIHGQAIRLSCKQKGRDSSQNKEEYFLVDYGITVPSKSESMLHGFGVISTSRIIDFQSSD